MKRVICGVDSTGKNSVILNETLVPFGAAHEPTEQHANEQLYVAWASQPVHSTNDLVNSLSGLDLRLEPGETRFMRVEIAPGARSAFHRTPHITDYLVALAGRLTMVAEDGTSAVLEPGDMLVQLGGWHQWRNEGDEPFVMAGVVVGVATDESVPGGVQIRPEPEEE
jgi:quercetin dioxygenase-like cupin family protein